MGVDGDSWRITEGTGKSLTSWRSRQEAGKAWEVAVQVCGTDASTKIEGDTLHSSHERTSTMRQVKTGHSRTHTKKK